LTLAVNDPLWKRLQLLVSLISVLAALAVLIAGWFWWRIRASLPQLDGNIPVTGLNAPVTILRDDLGVPTVSGDSRIDVARALGFLHAQDRFFQMDLLRRKGAGELAELFGRAAVPLDQAYRLHGFRHTAGKSLVLLEPEKRALLDAYTAGVNAGLAALNTIPWEYVVLRVKPEPWRPEDSLLVVHAMWLDLQDASGRLELSLDALRQALGQSGADFLAPRGTSWDAALDGSTFPVAPLPRFRLRNPGEVTSPAENPQPAGSNSFAVAGAHTNGSALLAGDMHLGLHVPHTWYRAVLAWTNAAGAPQRVVGVTLPGAPLMVVGSNSRIAWSYTNSYIDNSDVVVVETDTTAGAYYRTTEGFKKIIERTETINVKGEEPVTFATRWTEWGPIFSAPETGRSLALRWNAHNPESTDLNVIALETAENVTDALDIGRRSSMPNQNLVVADSAGAIGWTVTGRIPRRVGHDGRYPASWAYGDRRWDGWLAPEEIPAMINPPEGILWTANQRLVGGEAYAILGDNGYYGAARAAQIRDGLRELVAAGKSVAPADLLAVQLDDRALFLARWQKLFLTVLSDEAVAKKSDRGELRDAVKQWDGRASIDSAAYRLVRLWRLRVVERALAPFFQRAAATYPGFYYSNFQYEDALWQLVHDQPARLLNPAHTSWESLLLAAADDVLTETDRAGIPPDRFTNGRENTLSMKHPFSRRLPALFARLLDMPGDPLPGGSDMPRMQAASFGASARLVVAPGQEAEGIFHMPGGQSGHPLSPFYRAGHDAWVKGEATPLLPGPSRHTLTLQP
jgi:penicillin amidase